MRKRVNNIALVVRRICIGPCWQIYAWRKSVESAWAYYDTHVKGRGITAWAMVVPQEMAERMANDPDYIPTDRQIKAALRAGAGGKPCT